MPKHQPPKPEKSSTPDKIKELEEELSKTKYNKATQGHVGLVKAKIAMLKEKQIRRSAGKGKQEGFQVRKTGDATVIMVGYPSVGKSTILNKLTNAHSKVAAYAFTTLTVIPGLLRYKGSDIQVLDVPGILAGAAAGTGRGKEVLASAMGSDLVLFIVDATQPENLETLKKEVYEADLRINERKPFVVIEQKPRGGVTVGSLVNLTKTNEETIAAVAKEMRILNASILIRDDITVDQFIDVVEGNKRYVPGIVGVNKADLLSSVELEKLKREYSPDICISAELGLGIDELKELIFQGLRFLRVYCKEVGKKADVQEPLILMEGATLQTMCERLHRDFVKNFKFARIWGSSKFPGQEIRKLAYEVKDGDVVELHIR